ncbi:acyl carrier protein [Hymenobacter monticola]|uniref:Acyl carrier protein n=1 Tax=Hymenobacter monticola TaxID=1705399 RepID=A0ABY4BBZ2_9BACT|nr:acyl carrier protein [Hymenobacter monticola]UOE36414.1 acyl carrier protein [Hymenobacter monticola]
MLADVSYSPAPTKVLEQQVLCIISKRKAIKTARLRRSASLSRDLHFDTVDVVDIILELERNFHLTVPDEVPFYTVGDFVRYVVGCRASA